MTEKRKKKRTTRRIAGGWVAPLQGAQFAALPQQDNPGSVVTGTGGDAGGGDGGGGGGV